MAPRNDRIVRTQLSRRQFLMVGAGATAVSGGLLPSCERSSLPQGVDICGTRGESPYGRVAPTKDQATSLYLLALPQGFNYWSMGWTGDVLADGEICPGGHDGMAIVDEGGGVFTLIRNHEVFGLGSPIASTHNYDERGPAGTTVLTVRDGKTLINAQISISGTTSNCAGGRTPWGTWLTCEEGTDLGNKPHGYVFESTPWRVTKPQPLVQMGRFAHEAVAFDPRDGRIYLTEDNGSNFGWVGTRRRGVSGFYSFVPNAPLAGTGSLENGGALYMLKALDPETGDPVADLRNPACHSYYNVVWVLIEHPNADPVTVRSGPYAEGSDKGGTRFQRLEGCWWDRVTKRIIFVDTEGGPIGAQAGSTDRAEGAIWAYDPATKRLENLFVSQGALAPRGYGADNPDNVTVSPSGGILVCEDRAQNDGDGLLGLLPSGQSFEFARNIISIGRSDAGNLAAAAHNPDAIGTGYFGDYEFAGATFSRDGHWLFVNIQTPGVTFAITGPWNKGIFGVPGTGWW